MGKKNLNTLAITMITLMVIASCGTTARVANDPYLGEGRGESAVSKDIAREKAYSNAVADITRKFNREVSENARQDYESTENGKSKPQESLSFNSHLAQTSEARLGDVVIKKEKVYRQGKKWICEMLVAVSPDNIE